MSTEIFYSAAPVDDPYGEQAQARDQAEEQRERDTDALIAAVREFATAYGWPKTIEVIGRWAMQAQGELWQG